MRLRVRRMCEPPSRDAALRALQSLRKNRLLRPAADPTPGSVNDEYYGMLAGLGNG